MASQRLCAAANFAAACMMTMLAPVWAHARTYEVLYNFAGGSDGAYPSSALIKDAKGNIYGTTNAGGSGSACEMGCGTVFKLSNDGKETVLYSFKGGVDGASPYAGVIQDAQGNLYGTTFYGGNAASPGGCGTVFRLSKTGRETVLHRFAGKADGAAPIAGVIQDAEGNLYGTTNLGGNTTCSGGCGTVFKLNKTGQLTVLHRFTGRSDGGEPSGVIQDAEGNLYGTAEFGGDLSCGQYSVGCGNVFKLSKTHKYTVLYTFTGGADGANPNSGLIQDRQGNLYGTTYGGGSSACNPECGTVFKLAKGNETVLYKFKGPPDGQGPEGQLVRDARGNLYGITYRGGHISCEDDQQCGTVFKVSEQGKETVLYRFCSANFCSDGTEPIAGLIQDSNGNLYGTAAYGGNPDCGVEGSGCGVVFKLIP